MNRNPISPPAHVREADDLNSLTKQAHAALAAEDKSSRDSVERARDAGKILKAVKGLLSPKRKWSNWLTEQGITPNRASERIRIFDRWSSIPTEMVSKGVAPVIKFLKELLKDSNEEDGEEPTPEDTYDAAEEDDLSDNVTLESWNALSAAERDALLTQVGDRKFNAQGSNQNIEWALWSWNPVTGCLHDCPYCYARDIAERFYPQKFAPSLWPWRLKAPRNTSFPEAKIAAERAKGTPEGDAAAHGLGNVFVCSMADLFGRWVPREWIDAVLQEVLAAPRWTFLFLTKFPIRMAEFDFPENAWVGTTVDCQARVANAERAFRKVKAGVKWLSVEPMIEPLKFADLGAFHWVVIGGSSRSTQTREWHPPDEWVTPLKNEAYRLGVKVYEKSNIREGRQRQYPWEETFTHEAPPELRYLPTPEAP